MLAHAGHLANWSISMADCFPFAQRWYTDSELKWHFFETIQCRGFISLPEQYL